MILGQATESPSREGAPPFPKYDLFMERARADFRVAPARSDEEPSRSGEVAPLRPLAREVYVSRMATLVTLLPVICESPRTVISQSKYAVMVPVHWFHVSLRPIYGRASRLSA